MNVERNGGNYLFVGTSTGRLLIVDYADATSDLRNSEFYLAAAGSILALAYMPPVSGSNEFVIMGTSIGLVFVYDFNQKRIDSVILVCV